MDKWVLAARLIGVGFFIGGSIVLGVLVGLWLDDKFSTHFVWLIGLLSGIFIAFWGVYRMLLPLLNNNNNKSNRGRNS